MRSSCDPLEGEGEKEPLCRRENWVEAGVGESALGHGGS